MNATIGRPNKTKKCELTGWKNSVLQFPIFFFNWIDTAIYFNTIVVGKTATARW